MYTTKATLVLVLLGTSLALVSAAGGIKSQRPDDSQRVAAAAKGPRQQQAQFLPPQQLQPVELAAPAPAKGQPPAKGAGQVAPVFTALRVPPAAPIQAPIQAPPQIIQQQQQQQQEQEPEQQQQQQQEEIDPNAAGADNAAAIAAPARASEEEANPKPEPYAFTYAFEAGDQATAGSSQREEQQDASGKVTGFYTLKGEDGRDRRVDYIADADGFRATISTNEMGTAPKNSANVDWQAQAPTDAQLRNAEAATQAARQREALSGANKQASAAASASAPGLAKVAGPRQQQQHHHHHHQGKAAHRAQDSAAAASKGQPAIAAPAISQLQEPFEQIRQTEFNTRARKSRHAPFYLFTV